MSYDIKMRQHILKIRALEGLSFSKVAKRFGISKQTVYNWSKRIEEKKTRIKSTIKIDMKELKEDIEMYPDSYQYERAARFGASQGGMWYALKRLGVTYKKNPQASQGGFRKTICVLPKSEGA